jgi:hypothetical protein
VKWLFLIFVLAPLFIALAMQFAYFVKKGFDQKWVRQHGFFGKKITRQDEPDSYWSMMVLWSLGFAFSIAMFLSLAWELVQS